MVCVELRDVKGSGIARNRATQTCNWPEPSLIRLLTALIGLRGDYELD